MTVTSPTTIEVSSIAAGDPPRRKTAELLKHPTLDEIRHHQGSQEPLEFEWRLLGDEDPVTTPVCVTTILEPTGRTVIMGATGRPGGRYRLKVEIIYQDERPISFRYIEWM